MHSYFFLLQRTTDVIISTADMWRDIIAIMKEVESELKLDHKKTDVTAIIKEIELELTWDQEKLDKDPCVIIS